MTRMQRLRICASWRPDVIGYRDPAISAKIALKALARRILTLNNEIADLDRLIGPLVEELASGLLALPCVGVESAGESLVTAGDNPSRLRTEASFAMLCGASPIPASLGKTTRHRLNRGGNRQANSALHRVVVSRMRTDERTKAYVARRLRGGCRKGDHALPETMRGPRGISYLGQADRVSVAGHLQRHTSASPASGARA